MNNPTPSAIEFSIPQDIREVADRLVLGDPYGYVVNHDAIETKTPVYGVYSDRENNLCVLVLCRWIDNTAVWLRYYRTDLVLGEEAVAYLKKYNPKSMRILKKR